MQNYPEIDSPFRCHIPEDFIKSVLVELDKINASIGYFNHNASFCFYGSGFSVWTVRDEFTGLSIHSCHYSYQEGKVFRKSKFPFKFRVLWIKVIRTFHTSMYRHGFLKAYCFGKY